MEGKIYSVVKQIGRKLNYLDIKRRIKRETHQRASLGEDEFRFVVVFVLHGDLNGGLRRQSVVSAGGRLPPDIRTAKICDATAVSMVTFSAVYDVYQQFK